MTEQNEQEDALSAIERFATSKYVHFLTLKA